MRRSGKDPKRDDMQKRITRAQRRGQIIEAAASLFSRKGFNGTTTREVAQAVGVSEAAVFKHFATKEELYAAIIEAKSQTEQILSTAIAAANTRDDAQVLRALAREMIARVQADPTLMRLLLFSALEGHSLSEMFFRSRFQQVDRFLRRYIADRVAAGAFRAVDPGLAAWHFMGMAVYHILLRELFGQKGPPRLGLEQIVEEIAAVFLHGVCRSYRSPSPTRSRPSPLRSRRTRARS
jgi:AcrR family transcriptional regulator